MSDDDTPGSTPTDLERERGERWPGEHYEGGEGPAYRGEWVAMTPAQQSAYMHARRAWKRAQVVPSTEKGREKARDGSGAGVAASAPQENDAIAVLRHWSQNAPLPSDRIRAATELARAERAQAEVVTDEAQLWHARLSVMLTIPPHERLTWLLGEMREEEEAVPPAVLVEEDGWPDDDIVPPGGGTPAR